MTERYYQQVRWIHDAVDDPVVLWAHVVGCREVRKVDEFADGRLVWADERTESGGTWLSLSPMPTPEELAADPQFVFEVIPADVFERVRRRARRAAGPSVGEAGPPV